MKTLPNDIFFAEVERLISEGGSVVLTVNGYSMRPFIRSGRTRVVLSPCDTDSLRKGDVVLFRYRGGHVLHRIVKREGDRFILAGDGNYKIREQCTAADIVAAVVTIIGHNGREVPHDSLRWRWGSALWTSLHPFVRRCILALLWRMGIR